MVQLNRPMVIFVLCLAITCLRCQIALAHPAVKGTIEVIKIAELPFDQQLALYSLEGILNRKSPQLMVGTSSLFWSWPPSDHHLEQKLAGLGLRVEPLDSLQAAVARFGTQVRGVVIYDPSVDAERYAACTLAGIDDALPVTKSMLTGAIAKLPVVADFVGRWKTNEAVYRWAIKNLLPKCSRSVCYSAGVSYPGCNVGGDKSVTVGFDYAFYRRAFIFNLSPNSVAGYGYPAYPAQAATFKAILHSLPRLTEVFGWSEPEPEYCRLISQCGDSIVCSEAPNLSLYAALGRKWPFLANIPAHATDTHSVVLHNRYYVDFETNEADTPKIAASWQMGAWLSKDRGKVPISWGLTATLLNDAPVLYAAYQQTRTPMDSFFSGVSGGGYCLLDLLPNLKQYALHTKRLLQQAHERVTDVWETPGTFNPKLLQKYVTFTGVEGISHFPVAGRVGVYYLPTGVPVIMPAQSLFYYGTTSPKELARLIRATAKSLPRPGFIECYGGLSAQAPALYYQTMKDLGVRYQAVSLREMVKLARASSDLTISDCPRVFQTDVPQNAVITVRNFTTRRRSFSLQVLAPPGWIVAPGVQFRSVLQPFQVRHIPIRLRPTAAAYSGSLRVTDTRRKLASNYKIRIGTPIWLPIVDSPKGWFSWSADAAIFHLSGDTLTISCPANLPYAAAQVQLPFTPTTTDLLKISVLDPVGKWSVKLEPPGGGPDIVLIPDNAGIGTFYAHFPQADKHYPVGPWHLRLFAVGNSARFVVPMIEVLKVH